MAITVRPAHQAVQRLPDQFFQFAIERGGRLVQQKDGRVLEKRARDADALPLAGRELHASVTHDGVAPSGRFAMNSAQLAAITASCTSASDASGRP